MTRLKWGEGDKPYDMGIDRGVLYPETGQPGVPWNGLVSVDETDTSETVLEHYFEGNRVYISQVIGDFDARISAYTYPDAFAEYNGYSEGEKPRLFGLCYRSHHGDSYKLHVVYNVLVRDISRDHNTLNPRFNPELFNWDAHSQPVDVPGAKPAARLTMGVGRDPSILSEVEDILYGTETTEPRLPSPFELYQLYEGASLLKITYNADGSFTADGPDDMVVLLADGKFEINSPSAFLDEDGAFTVSSY